MRRYRTIYPSTVRTLLGRAAGRLRWLGWTVRQPALRSGPAIDVGRGAAISLTGTGKLVRGDGVRAREDLTLNVQGTLTLGEGVFLGRGVHIACFDAVTIGDEARLAERVSLHDENHVSEPLDDRAGRLNDYLTAPITIGQRVWLGTNVVVLPGVTIGDDTIVAAGSVVTRDLPPGVMAAGTPAIVRRSLS